jgi:hypothetical protein
MGANACDQKVSEERGSVSDNLVGPGELTNARLPTRVLRYPVQNQVPGPLEPSELAVLKVDLKQDIEQPKRVQLRAP